MRLRSLSLGFLKLATLADAFDEIAAGPAHAR